MQLFVWCWTRRNREKNLFIIIFLPFFKDASQLCSRDSFIQISRPRAHAKKSRSQGENPLEPNTAYNVGTKSCNLRKAKYCSGALTNISFPNFLQTSTMRHKQSINYCRNIRELMFSLFAKHKLEVSSR